MLVKKPQESNLELQGGKQELYFRVPLQQMRISINKSRRGENGSK